MLCIRSQDKMFLGKVERIYINNNFMDKTFDVFGDDYLVGEYKTKERALEVLDEIQNFIEEKDIEGNRYYEGQVYKMPEE